MAYRMAGQYVATCSCSLVCPCPVDGPPTGPEGTCRGAMVWQVSEGSLDGTDLGGVNYALYFYVPSNLSAGDITMQLVVDEGASEEQAEALMRILSGKEGGPFGDFAPLISTFRGPDRARVTFSDGDSPSGSIGGETELAFEPLRGPDGSPTTMKNAMFGFSPEFQLGKGSGRSSAPDFSYEPVYGEASDFEFSSEMGGDVRPRA
jgi:hypothetical protein